MNATAAYQQYRTTQAQTADRGDLVVMLYQGALRFLARASVALDARDLQEAHTNIVRSQDIIAELMSSLNMSTGNVAQNLYRIYEYMHFRLVQANVQKDRQGLDEVAKLLRELLPAWQFAAQSTRTAPPGDRSPMAASLNLAAV